MAYKQTPGRGNSPKTGHGLPTPLRQDKDHGGKIELTKKYTEGVKTLEKQRKKGNTPGGMSIDAQTGAAKPNLPMHKVVKAGSYVRELDTAGKVVKEERMDSRGNEAFYKNVANRNADVAKRQTANASLYNATSGGTSPDKLSESQKKSLVSIGKATPAKQRMKMAPAKMKKC